MRPPPLVPPPKLTPTPPPLLCSSRWSVGCQRRQPAEYRSVIQAGVIAGLNLAPGNENIAVLLWSLFFPVAVTETLLPALELSRRRYRADISSQTSTADGERNAHADTIIRVSTLLLQSGLTPACTPDRTACVPFSAARGCRWFLSPPGPWWQHY